MEICKKERMIAKGQFLRWKGNTTILMAFGMEIILLIEYLWGYTDFGLKNGTQITPYVLFILFEEGTISVNLPKVMVYLGCILILSEIPFLDETTPYLLTRSKRGAWWKGECLYIWGATFVYMLFLTVMSLLVVLPTVTWNGLWGSTIAGILEDPLLFVPQEIVKVFYPWFVFVITFLFGWISMAVLGHIAYAVSLCTGKKILGLGIMVFFVLLDPIVKWLGSGNIHQWMFLFSPVSWSSMQNWKMVNIQAPMEIPYMLGAYAVLLLLSLIVIAVSAKRKPIEVISLQ